MGRRKAFIDKKHATTYSLVCDEGPQQQQAGSVSQGGFASSLFPVEQGVSLSETKREQIVELGLPDDGYDYLQHVRDPAQDGLDSVDGEDGGGGAGGPRVFLPAPYLEPPPEDVRLFDARALPLPAAPAKQDDALPFSSTVTAFSREIEEQPPKQAQEVHALTEVTRLLERAGDAVGSQGSGDLLDDFVVAAAARARNMDDTAEDTASMAGSEDSSQDGFAGDMQSQHGARKAGSIASTYWRAERQDRGALSVLDERFERLALGYDSDELGDLDSEGSAEPFDAQLAQHIAGHMPEVDVGQETRPYTCAPATDAAGNAGEADARVAIRKAKELISAGLLLEEDDVVPAHLLPAWSAQAWDCESVLSRHSTLDNHPGLLAEPRHARRQHRAAHSRLVAHQEGLEADGAEAARGADGDAATVGAGTEGLSQGSRAGESCEEKRERKAEVKAQRRVAREVKKASSKMYKAGSLAARTASHADGGVRVFPLSS